MPEEKQIELVTDEGTLIAFFENREFRVDLEDKEACKQVRADMIATLKAFHEQRLRLKRETRQLFRAAAADNHIKATELLILAINACRNRALFTEPLHKSVGGKPGKQVLCEAPWDLMDYIGRYHDKNFVQTADVTYPNGRPENVRRVDEPATVLSQIDDMDDDVEEVAAAEAEDDDTDTFGKE